MATKKKDEEDKYGLKSILSKQISENEEKQKQQAKKYAENQEKINKASNYENWSTAGKIAGQVGVGLAEMVPSMVVGGAASKVLGGAAKAAIAAKTASVANNIKKAEEAYNAKNKTAKQIKATRSALEEAKKVGSQEIAKTQKIGAKLTKAGATAAGTATFMPTAYSGSLAQALNEGASMDDARKYATASALKEAGTEAMFGIPYPGAGVVGGAVANKLKNPLLRTAGKLTLGAAEEGAEEAVAELVDTPIQRATYNPNAQVDWNNVVNAALVGGITGGIMHGVSMIGDPNVLNIPADKRTPKQHGDAKRIVDYVLQESQNKANQGQGTTPEQKEALQAVVDKKNELEQEDKKRQETVTYANQFSQAQQELVSQQINELESTDPERAAAIKWHIAREVLKDGSKYTEADRQRAEQQLVQIQNYFKNKGVRVPEKAYDPLFMEWYKANEEKLAPSGSQVVTSGAVSAVPDGSGVVPTNAQVNSNVAQNEGQTVSANAGNVEQQQVLDQQQMIAQQQAQQQAMAEQEQQKAQQEAAYQAQVQEAKSRQNQAKLEAEMLKAEQMEQKNAETRAAMEEKARKKANQNLISAITKLRDERAMQENQSNVVPIEEPQKMNGPEMKVAENVSEYKAKVDEAVSNVVESVSNGANLDEAIAEVSSNPEVVEAVKKYANSNINKGSRYNYWRRNKNGMTGGQFEPGNKAYKYDQQYPNQRLNPYGENGLTTATSEKDEIIGTILDMFELQERGYAENITSEERERVLGNIGENGNAQLYDAWKSFDDVNPGMMTYDQYVEEWLGKAVMKDRMDDATAKVKSYIDENGADDLFNYLHGNHLTTGDALHPNHRRENPREAYQYETPERRKLTTMLGRPDPSQYRNYNGESEPLESNSALSFNAEEPEFGPDNPPKNIPQEQAVAEGYQLNSKSPEDPEYADTVKALKQFNKDMIANYRQFWKEHSEIDSDAAEAEFIAKYGTKLLHWEDDVVVPTHRKAKELGLPESVADSITFDPNTPYPVKSGKLTEEDAERINKLTTSNDVSFDAISTGDGVRRFLELSSIVNNTDLFALEKEANHATMAAYDENKKTLKSNLSKEELAKHESELKAAREELNNFIDDNLVDFALEQFDITRKDIDYAKKTGNSISVVYPNGSSHNVFNKNFDPAAALTNALKEQYPDTYSSYKAITDKIDNLDNKYTTNIKVENRKKAMDEAVKKHAEAKAAFDEYDSTYGNIPSEFKVNMDDSVYRFTDRYDIPDRNADELDVRNVLNGGGMGETSATIDSKYKSNANHVVKNGKNGTVSFESPETDSYLTKDDNNVVRDKTNRNAIDFSGTEASAGFNRYDEMAASEEELKGRAGIPIIVSYYNPKTDKITVTREFFDTGGTENEAKYDKLKSRMKTQKPNDGKLMLLNMRMIGLGGKVMPPFDSDVNLSKALGIDVDMDAINAYMEKMGETESNARREVPSGLYREGDRYDSAALRTWKEKNGYGSYDTEAMYDIGTDEDLKKSTGVTENNSSAVAPRVMDESELSEKQRITASVLSKNTGVKIHFVDKVEGNRPAYFKDGEIYLNASTVDTATGIISEVSHELVHNIQTDASAATREMYKQLLDYAENWARMKYSNADGTFSLEAALNATRQAYENAGIQLTDADVEKEFVARQIQEMFTEHPERILELSVKKPSLIRRFLDMINRIVKELRGVSDIQEYYDNQLSAVVRSMNRALQFSEGTMTREQAEALNKQDLEKANFSIGNDNFDELMRAEMMKGQTAKEERIKGMVGENGGISRKSFNGNYNVDVEASASAVNLALDQDNNLNEKSRAHMFDKLAANPTFTVKGKLAKNQVYQRSVTNQETIDEAVKDLNAYAEKNNGNMNGVVQELENIVINGDTTLSAKGIAKLDLLFLHFQNSGQQENAELCLDLIALSGADSGRAVQAQNILKELNPNYEAQLLNMTINRLNIKLAKQGYGKIEIPDEMMKKFETATDELERDKAYRDILTYLGSEASTFNPLEAFDAWRYFAMLSNPKTHIRNIIGNYVRHAVDIPKNKIAGYLEDNMANGNKKPVERFHTLRKSNKYGTIEQYRNFVEAKLYTDKNIIKGLKGGKFDDMASDIRDELNPFGKGQAAKNLKAVTKTTGTLLNMEDIEFKKMTFIDSMASYMLANDIPLDNAQSFINRRTGASFYNGVDFAMEQARRATFTEKRVKNQKGQDLADMITDVERSNMVTRVLIGAMMPFKRTPLNILEQGIEFSPIGLMSSIYKMTTNTNERFGTQQQLIDELATGLTGTAVMALGFALAGMGVVTAEGDDDDSERKSRFDSQMGDQKYCINMRDGSSMTIDWLAPAAMPLLVGARLYEMMDGETRGDESRITSALEGLSKLANPMFEMSCLQGVNNVLSEIENSENTSAGVMKVVGSSIADYGSQAIPSIAGAAARTIDDTQRRTSANKGEGFGASWIKQQQAKIPGASALMEPYVTVWGEDKKREMSGPLLTPARFANNFLNPSTYSSNKRSTLEKELDRIYEATGVDTVYPTTASSYVSNKYTNGTYYMNQKEYTQFAKTKGQLSKKYVQDFMDSDSYQYMDDTEKANIINKLYTLATHQATEELLNSEKNNMGYEMDDSDIKVLNTIQAFDGELDAGTIMSVSTGLGKQSKKEDKIAYLKNEVANGTITPEQYYYFYAVNQGKSISKDDVLKIRQYYPWIGKIATDNYNANANHKKKI